MSRETFQSLEAQLLRAIEAGDFDRVRTLVEAGADPFKQTMVMDLPEDIRHKIEEALARRAPPDMEGGDG